MNKKRHQIYCDCYAPVYSQLGPRSAKRDARPNRTSRGWAQLQPSDSVQGQPVVHAVIFLLSLRYIVTRFSIKNIAIYKALKIFISCQVPPRRAQPPEPHRSDRRRFSHPRVGHNHAIARPARPESSSVAADRGAL